MLSCSPRSRRTRDPRLLLHALAPPSGPRRSYLEILGLESRGRARGRREEEHRERERAGAAIEEHWKGLARACPGVLARKAQGGGARMPGWTALSVGLGTTVRTQNGGAVKKNEAKRSALSSFHHFREEPDPFAKTPKPWPPPTPPPAPPCRGASRSCAMRIRCGKGETGARGRAAKRRRARGGQGWMEGGCAFSRAGPLLSRARLRSLSI